jgi:serine phosphatase RsbU (regulator of sigma subunit)
MPEDLGLIELNLQAGQKAKASAAYETALKYFTTARSLLSETSWDSNYHLTLQIHQNQAECQYFITQFDQAEANFQEILNTAHNPLDRATIYNIQVLLYTNLGQNFDAVEIGVNALLCTPIINQGKLSGVIYLENNLATGAFTPERIELLQVISSQAAISLENAQLYRNLEDKVIERTAQLASANEEISALNERLKSDNLRMSAELDITRQLQQKMLPRPEELQEISGLEIAGFMEAADEVGGDYYDVLNYDGRIKIGIGDVTGHGLESGMVMVQTAVRTLLANNETDYIKFLSTLNRTIYDNVERMNADKNLTLVLLDYADGVLQISGQHEEIIVVRANGDIERIDTINLGFPIGLVTEIADFITQSEVQLNPGDGVVLYTDGITEAANMTNKQYGIERLCEVASQNWQYSAEEVRKIVIEDLRKFIGEQKVFDDITLVVLKPK